MSKPNLERDTTIADIHETRKEISDAFQGDIRAITEDAKRRQAASGRETVSFAKRRPAPDNASDATEQLPPSTHSSKTAGTSI